MSTRSSRRTITPSVKALEVVSNAPMPATPATAKRTRSKATDFFAEEAAPAAAEAAEPQPEEAAAPAHSPHRAHRRSWTHTFPDSGVKEQRLHRREEAPVVPASPALSTRRSTKIGLDLFALDALQSPSPARKKATAKKTATKQPEPVEEEEEEAEEADESEADAADDVPAGALTSSLSSAMEDVHEDENEDFGGQEMLMNDVDADLFNGEGIPEKKQTKQAKAKTPAKAKQTPTPTPAKSNKRKLELSDDEDEEEEAEKPSSRFIQPFDEKAEAKKRAAAEAEKKQAALEHKYDEDDDEDDEDDDGPQVEMSFKSSKHSAQSQQASEQAALDAAMDAAAKKKAALLVSRQKQSALNRAAQLKAAVGGKGKGAAALDVKANLNADGTLSVAFLDALTKAESEAKKQQKEEAEYARAKEEEEREEEEAKRRQKKKPKLQTVKQSGRFTVVLDDPAVALRGAAAASAPAAASSTGTSKSLYLTQMAYAPITNTNLLNFRMHNLYNNGMVKRQELNKNYAKVKVAQVQKQAKQGITANQLHTKQQMFKGAR